MKIPKAYQRNSQTKLLWLYKSSLISRARFLKAMSKLTGREQ